MVKQFVGVHVNCISLVSANSTPCSLVLEHENSDETYQCASKGSFCLFLFSMYPFPGIQLWKPSGKAVFCGISISPQIQMLSRDDKKAVGVCGHTFCFLTGEEILSRLGVV